MAYPELKANWRHFSSHVEICDFLNSRHIEQDKIVSINNDNYRNWYLLYYEIEWTSDTLDDNGN